MTTCSSHRGKLSHLLGCSIAGLSILAIPIQAAASCLSAQTLPAATAQARENFHVELKASRVIAGQISNL